MDTSPKRNCFIDSLLNRALACDRVYNEDLATAHLEIAMQALIAQRRAGDYIVGIDMGAPEGDRTVRTVIGFYPDAEE